MICYILPKNMRDSRHWLLNAGTILTVTGVVSLLSFLANAVHESPCNRRTALGKLQCALASDVLITCDPEKDIRPLLRSLLEWFNLPAPSHEMLVLSMLSRLAHDDGNRKILLDLGAVEFMEQYQRDCGETILPYVITLLHNLHKQHMQEEGEMEKLISFSDKTLGYVIPTNGHCTHAGFATGECWVREGGLLHEISGGQTQGEECNLLGHRFDGVCQNNDDPCAVIFDIPPINTQFKEKESVLPLDRHSDGLHKGKICPGSPKSVTCIANVAGVSCQLWSPYEDPEIPTITGKMKPPPKPPKSHTRDVSDALALILPCVTLEESDNKYLLNLNATLQYLDDREVLLAALKELREAVVFDFHPEAILQKYSIVQNTFVLLQKITDSNLQQIVFDFLLELVRQIKAAIKLSRNADFQVHLDKESPLHRLIDGGGSGCAKLGVDLEYSYPVYLKSNLHTPEVTREAIHLLAGQKLDTKGNIRPVIALGHTAHLIALQLISLLVNERHQDMTFSILYELLPILQPPGDKSLDDKVQGQFGQYFQALCGVMEALGGSSQDLEILCMDVTTKRNFDKRAHDCLPLVRVLIFSADVLCLLRPSNVTGLLPSTLVKSFITLAGDLVLSQCTFETRKRILPYLKYLDPEFFRTYTCASEASFTLHMLVKVLASSEEEVAQWKANGPNPPCKINAELLLKCMIQAAPSYAYFNHKYLIPRLVHIIPDVLMIEVVKACQEGCANGRAESEQSNKRSRELVIESLINQARSLIWLLLSHACATVRKVAYDSLLEVSFKKRQQIQECRISKPKHTLGWEQVCTIKNERIFINSDEPGCLLYNQNGALQPWSVIHRLLIFGTNVMGEIVTVGLHDAATCKQSAQLLLHLVQELSEVERTRIISGYPWISCCSYISSDLLPILQQLTYDIFQPKTPPQKECSPLNLHHARSEWVELSCILFSLFSSSTTERCRASTELLKIMRKWCISEEFVICWWLNKVQTSDFHSSRGLQKPGATMVFDDPFHYVKDPFQKYLKSQDATLFSLAFGSAPLQEIRNRGKVRHPPGEEKKMEDLLSTFKTSSAGENMRKMAVNHLIWLIQDQSLRSLMGSDEELFKALISEIVYWMRKGEITARGPSDRSSPERSDTSPSDLGMTCLSFLARLAGGSASDGIPNVRDMIINNSGHVLRWLLPLIFHPLESVRKDMAMLLAFSLFSSDHLFRGLREMVFDDDQSPYTMTRTGDISDTSLNSVGKDMWIPVPAPFAGGYLFPCKVVSVAVRSPTLETKLETHLVDGQLVQRIIKQSVLLEGGHEKLLNVLERRVTSGDSLTPLEVQAMACLSVMHADITIKKLLKLLSDPQLSYGLEIPYLEDLEAQCFRHPEAAKMLARASWVPTFQRFVTHIPSTTEESLQLLKVLKLTQIIIDTKCAGSHCLLFMIMVSKQILLPLLAKSPTPEIAANLHHAIVLIEGYPAFDMDFTILRLFVDVLLYSKEYQDGSLFGWMATSLAKGTSLLPVLLSKFVKGPNAPYICCVLAVQCLSLVTKGIAAAFDRTARRPQVLERVEFYEESSSEASFEQQEDTGTRNSTDMPHKQESENLNGQEDCLWTIVGGGLVEVVLPLLSHMSHLQSHHYLSLRHKRLVREIVSCLWSVTSCVPPFLWEDLWTSTGITYWLSRLLDDRETTIRGMGFGILSVLASPVLSKTRKFLEQNWPEVGDVAVQTVLNTHECYAVREEALRFLVSAAIWTMDGQRVSATVERNSLPAGFERIDSLGVNTALQRYKFWVLFPSMLQERGATPGFYGVLVELILKLAVLDVSFIKNKLSMNPEVFEALTKYLDFGTGKEKGHPPRKCLHSLDIYGTKSCIGEIISILGQEDDAYIQSLIRNEDVIAKLLGALSYCLGCENSEISTTGDASTEFDGTLLKMDKVDCGSVQTLCTVTEYERLEAIFHVSEALNLVVSQALDVATRDSKRATNHIRVDDLMSFELREGEPEDQQQSLGCPSKSGFQMRLGIMIGKSGVCRHFPHILSNLPFIRALHSVKKSNSSRLLGGLLKRLQLAVCALAATFLSDESLANAILENDIVAAVCGDDSKDSRQKSTSLVPILYNSFLGVINDVHDLGRQPRISRKGDFLVDLRKALFTSGLALRHLITFSPQAKDFAVDSNLPTKLMRIASETFELLGSCGHAAAPVSSIVIGSANNRSRHCNKVPKVIAHQNFSRVGGEQTVSTSSSIWSRKARQGKLSEHHRTLLLDELIICFGVVKTLVYQNVRAADASISEGVFDFVRLLWGFALSEEQLLHQILGFFSNLAAQNEYAKEAMACQTQIFAGGGKGGSIMDHAVAIVLRLPSDQTSYTLAVGLLQTLVTMGKARALFLRKQYLTDFLQHFGQNVRNNDVLRQHLVLQVLINLSVFPNGQKMLTKGLSDGSMLDLVLDTVEQTNYVPACSSALFLLRNLAFFREARFFFLCNERTLPLLVKSLASSSLEARANASSALWILTSTERRISSVLKKLDARSNLRAAHDTAKLHLEIYQSRVGSRGENCAGTGPGIAKMGKLVRHIEQSLFAVNQLVGASTVD